MAQNPPGISMPMHRLHAHGLLPLKSWHSPFSAPLLLPKPQREAHNTMATTLLGQHKVLSSGWPGRATRAALTVEGLFEVHLGVGAGANEGGGGEGLEHRS